MEKPQVQTISTSKNVKKKERAMDHLEDLWGRSSTIEGNSKHISKKLVVKLETNGAEKRKILLKLECGKSNINSNNYHLLSDLLKEFFSPSSPSE
ncbi:MAG: hypothetical protein HWN79_05395 [Candidatus Lokiarchaeota archaeon]|nr:hypothetical protein [Candidatus Lokiarchaeota archaeon]